MMATPAPSQAPRGVGGAGHAGDSEGLVPGEGRRGSGSRPGLRHRPESGLAGQEWPDHSQASQGPQDAAPSPVAERLPTRRG